MMVILWWNLSRDESNLVMKVMIVKELMTGDVLPLAMFGVCMYVRPKLTFVSFNFCFFCTFPYWKILFSPPDFEPTSVRNCQFLTPPVRNCQHAVPEQVLGLEQSEQHGCPQGWTRGESQNTSPRVKKHLCPCASCKRGRCSSSQNAFEVCNFSEQKISLCMQ